MSPSQDLAPDGLWVAPPLTITGIDLPALAEAGGPPFDQVINGWRTLLGLPIDSSNSNRATVALRVEAVMDILGEAQAQRILAGRVEVTPPVDPGAVARQRGALLACCAALRIDRPSPGEAPRETLARLRAAAEQVQPAAVDMRSIDAVAEPSASTASRLLIGGSLGDADMDSLGAIAAALAEDYSRRRLMLLKRLEVMTATFATSPRVADRKDELLRTASELIGRLPPPATFNAVDAYAADSGLLELQRAIPLSRADASVKKVRIGNVPDRGGRTGDSYAASETYAQQDRSREGKGGGTGGGHGGGGRGGAGRSHGRGKGGGGGSKGSGGGTPSSGGERVVTIVKH